MFILQQKQYPDYTYSNSYSGLLLVFMLAYPSPPTNEQLIPHPQLMNSVYTASWTSDQNSSQRKEIEHIAHYYSVVMFGVLMSPCSQVSPFVTIMLL